MKTTKSTTTTTKKCWILRRYTVKSSGSICAIIRNGEGTEYTTCLHSNGRLTCTCEAGQRERFCYHKRHLHVTEYTRTLGEMPAQEDEQSNRSTMTVEPHITVETSNDTRPTHREAKSVIVGRTSSVEASAPVWMMRGFANNGWMAGSR